MNHIEEQLWNYIDGSCSVQEQQAISHLIATDANWRSRYHELLQLNAELQAIDIEEPPMAFTYNVMEAIRTGEARQPLKAAINPKVILIIGGLFMLSIIALMVSALSGIHWSANTAASPLTDAVHWPALKNTISAPVIKAFICFDVLAALALFDGYLRRRNFAKQV